MGGYRLQHGKSLRHNQTPVNGKTTLSPLTLSEVFYAAIDSLFPGLWLRVGCARNWAINESPNDEKISIRYQGVFPA